MNSPDHTLCVANTFAVMTRLSLATRKSSRRNTFIALWLWFIIMQSVNWFWLIVIKHLEYHVKSISSRPRNNYNSYKRRKCINNTLHARDSADYQSMTTHIKEATSVLASEIAKATQILCKAVEVDAEISKKRQKIDSEIRKIPNLTVSQVIKAVCRISSRPELIDVFFSMKEEHREQLVRAILNGEV